MLTLVKRTRNPSAAGTENRDTGFFYQPPVFKNPPIKVMHYYPDFGAKGGIGRLIHHIGVSFRHRQTVESIIVCCEGTPFYHQMKAAGFKVYGLPIPQWMPRRLLHYYSKPLLRLLDWPKLAQLWIILKQEKPDIVHVHIGRLENAWFKCLGFPLVYTFHGYGSPYNIRDTKNPVERFLIRRGRFLFRALMPSLDALMCVSQSEQERLVEEGFLPDTAPAEVVYNGLPIAQIIERAEAVDRRKLRRAIGIPADAVCLSFINRIDKFKNPMDFIRLANRLSGLPGLPPMRFLIAGSGHLEKDVLKAIQQSPYRYRFHYVGHRTDVIDLLAITDLAVCLPKMEGFGLSVLEAMASGTPCLCYGTGGIAEIMDLDAAECLMAPPGDFDTLTQKAIGFLMLPRPEQNAIARQLQARAWDFDISVLTEQLEGVYARTLAKYGKHVGANPLSADIGYTAGLPG